MTKLKAYLLIAWGALSAFFMLVIQLKNRKIDKQHNEIKQHKSKHNELKYINEQETKAKHDKNTINSNDDTAIDELLDKTNSYRD